MLRGIQQAGAVVNFMKLGYPLDRQMHRQRRQVTMAANAVAKVADWDALRALAGTDLEPAVRRFGAYWLARLPQGLTAAQLALLGDYY